MVPRRKQRTVDNRFHPVSSPKTQQHPVSATKSIPHTNRNRARTLLAILALTGLFIFAATQLSADLTPSYPTIWSFGFHTTTPYTLITHWSLPLTGAHAVVPMVLISNLPQTLLSAVYLGLNGLLTTMSLAREWAAHAASSSSLPLRSLRVSSSAPRGDQRSAYFLSLPYRLAVPFAALATLAHWLLSQSLYMVKVDAVDAHGDLVRDGADGGNAYGYYSITTCGYSPPAIVASAVGIVAFAAFVCGVGAKRLGKNGMPLVGSCSAAIAASCHGGARGGTVVAWKPLAWGEVVGGGGEGEDGEGVGRCGFANDGGVERPVPGKLYA